MDENGNSKTIVAPLGRLEVDREVGEFRFQLNDKADLLDLLDLPDRPDGNPATIAFITTIEHEIAKFRVVKKIDAERKDAADSRNTLKRLATALRKLSTELDEMPDSHPDAYLRLSLGLQSTFCPVPTTPPEPPPWDPGWEHSPHGFSVPSAAVDSFVSLLMRDLQALEDATARALKIGKDDTGGQRVKAAQTFLARSVAQAFREQLKEEPTTTEEGIFEKVLRLCLKAGGEADVDDANNPRDLHTLVMKTLSDRKSTEP